MERVTQQLVISIAQQLPDALLYKPLQDKVVALTIDDVPTPGDVGDRDTHLILDTLSVYNQTIPDSRFRARATFFVITSHLNQTEVLHRMLDEGHEIGNHGVFDNLAAGLPIVEFTGQFWQAHHQLYNITQQPIRWFRPGRAFYTPDMVNLLKQAAGYEPRMALASMVPLDTTYPTHHPIFTQWYLSQFIFPGSILLLHGGSALRTANTVSALSILLRLLYEKQYRVVTLSELWDWQDDLSASP